MSKCLQWCLIVLLVARSLSFRIPQDRALAWRLRRCTQRQPRTTFVTRSTTNRFPTILRAADELDSLSTFPLVPLLVVVALGLGFSAQGWINKQLDGDQGLGAYLKDGPGYKKSGFRPLTDGDRAASSDPLPWLSLPKLDFVEVAGQETDEDKLMAELDNLRNEMNNQLQSDNAAEANAIRTKLEILMKENGIEFQSD